MLIQSRVNLQKEDIDCELVRCDSARLPFKNSSIDAIHAGAAMHCWPRLNESLREIYRALKPGGAFYSSTFFTQESSIDVGGEFVKGLTTTANQQGFYLFASKDEIESLVEAAGFGGGGGSCVVRKEGNRCAIVRAIKAI
jgi:ubiquinone/menaquinone biosynthesis C-methylase UbiE